MLMMTFVLLSAAVVVFALHRKRNVTFNMKLPGAHLRLDARDDDGDGGAYGWRDDATPARRPSNKR